MPRHLFAILCLLTLLHMSTTASMGQPQPVTSRWEKAILAFEESDEMKFPRKGCVLFVGSSSITRWDTDAGFPDRNVLNRGFGGSQTEDQLQFMDRIVWKYEPTVIVYYCGDNDINAKKTPAEVIENVMTFRERVAEKLPNTKFVYLPIKPSLKRWALWDQMSEVNAAIRKASEKDGKFHYCDVATPMLDQSGEPRPELFAKDGLHLSEAGYVLWNAEVEKMLKELSPAR